MTRTLRFAAIVLAGLCAAPAHSAPPKPDADDGDIKLPAGFRALVVADDLGPLRHVAVAPNGDIYAKTRRAGIIALRDTNGDGRADVTESFGGGGGTGIAVRDGWLYHSSTTTVYRYKLTPGQLSPSGPQETIVAGLPDEDQHNSKAFAFDASDLMPKAMQDAFNKAMVDYTKTPSNLDTILASLDKVQTDAYKK